MMSEVEFDPPQFAPRTFPTKPRPKVGKRYHFLYYILDIEYDELMMIPHNISTASYYQFSVSVKPFHFFHQIAISGGLSSITVTASLNIQRLSL